MGKDVEKDSNRIRPKFSPTGTSGYEKKIRKKIGFTCDELKVED